MKILHASTHSYFQPCQGGVERFVLDLCNYSREQGLKTEIVTIINKSPNGKKQAVEAVAEGTKLKRLNFLGLKDFYEIVPGITNSTKGFDLIHVHGLGFIGDWLLFLKWLGLMKTPVVVSTHGGALHNKSLAWLKKIYFKFLQRWLLNQANKVIAISQNDFKEFSKIIKSDKLALIENGVDLKPFLAAKRKPAKNSFLFVGRLVKHKQVAKLIETLGFLNKQGVNAELRIIGQDAAGIKPSLIRLAKALGVDKNVAFLNQVNQKGLWGELSRAEYFASASSYEGFGISAIEAMAAGCIPLLQPNDSFKNFIKKGNGFLVDYSQPEAAALTIRQVMKLSATEKQKITVQAKKSVEKFDWNKKIKEFIKIYGMA